MYKKNKGYWSSSLVSKYAITYLLVKRESEISCKSN